MRRWVLMMMVGAVLLSGCTARYTYRTEEPERGRIKGYVLADGTFVRVHPKHGRIKGYILADGTEVKIKRKKGKGKGNRN